MIAVQSGTYTTAGVAEETLATISAPGRYRLVVDLNAVVGGPTPDIYEFRVKAAVLAGGTENMLYGTAVT